MKTEIDVFLSLCLKFDMKKIRISLSYIKYTLRSSRLQMFFQKGALENFAIFTGKQPVLKSLLLKLKAFRPEKNLQCRCFPVNIAKFSRVIFYRTRLLLYLEWMNFFIFVLHNHYSVTQSRANRQILNNL